MKPESHILKLIFILTISLILVAHNSWSQSLDQDIEILDVIEIPGTPVIVEERQFIFPNPEIDDFPKPTGYEGLGISPDFQVNHNHKMDAVALDPVGLNPVVKTPPKLIKKYTPPYPLPAKELNWEGTVLLVLTVEPDGTVSSSKIHTSSGHKFLDNLAIDSTKHWLFEPKKDGEFPVKGKLYLPFHFNID